MSSLLRQQLQMQTLVVAGGDSGGFLRDGQVPVEKRLLIYQNAYRGRLIEALKLNFPVLRLTMGDEAFDEMALEFIAERPSRRRSIRWFGEHLEAFLRARPQMLPHPALLDVARLEWALCLAFDSADAPLLSAEVLVGLSPQAWTTLAFQLHQSVSLLELDWEVEGAFQALLEDEASETEAPALRKHTCVVWRQGLGPKWRVLDSPEAECLRGDAAGCGFVALCEVAAEHLDTESTARGVAGYLQGWVAAGMLSAL